MIDRHSLFSSLFAFLVLCYSLPALLMAYAQSFLVQLKNASSALQADIEELCIQLADGSLQNDLRYKVR